jgi:LacI family transcriptional regulator
VSRNAWIGCASQSAELRSLTVEPMCSGSGDRNAPPRVERPTMRSVAALAGVSLSTVSRVFNSEAEASHEVVSRVRKAALQLNDQPNRTASDLRRRDGRPSTIGLLIQDVGNEFSASIFRAVEDVASKYGVSVLASNLDGDVERERALVANLVARRVSGLLIVPASYDHSYLNIQQQAGTPVVFIDRPPLFLAADNIVCDNQAGAFRGVMHLAQFGHRRIAFLGESNAHSPASQRFAGYVDALRAIGAELDLGIVRRDVDTVDGAAAACLEMLSSEEPPTAFFTAHNTLTLGAVRTLVGSGSEYRRALVGFDDFPLFDFLRPAITVVAQDARTIGRLGAERLFERISGDVSPISQQVVETHLIVRGSGEISARTP